MWQKVAIEMGIPWRSAESMHWQLGEQEMSARANAPVFRLHPPGASKVQNAQIPCAADPIPDVYYGRAIVNNGERVLPYHRP